MIHLEELEDQIRERFSSRITVCGEDNCWIWRGEINRNGYGRVNIYGRKLMTHRVLYELLVGSIPEGLVLDHRCRNRACCNPMHLEPVTPRENTLRGEAKLFRRVEDVH